MSGQATLDKITALSKRRGFVYPSSEIYGGLANTWDFGHYGVLLKKNIANLWWKHFVESRDDMVGIEASVFLNPKIWEASGHVGAFVDALIDCKNCNRRTRADHLIEDQMKEQKAEGLHPDSLTAIIKQNNLKCPYCASQDLTDVRTFNLLFETKLGVVKGASSLFLRGELAQGIFVNFKNIIDSMRVKIPFGIAQIGKAFRNEITMGQFIHRTLEFDLMEFEYFTEEKDWEKHFDYWQKKVMDFALSLGLDKNNLQWRKHSDAERAHYSKKTVDLDYKYPFGWKEMFAIAYRTDFDLKNHSKHTKKDLSYKDPKTGKSFIPHVIEPTFGLSRLVGVILFDAYREEKIKEKTRIYLALDPKIAPVKTAIFPLQKDKKLQNEARKIYKMLKKSFPTEYDDAGNIGKMYRRQDEIGTPFCITVDYDTLESSTITVRERDTMRQERIKIDKLAEYLNAKFI